MLSVGQNIMKYENAINIIQMIFIIIIVCV